MLSVVCGAIQAQGTESAPPAEWGLPQLMQSLAQVQTAQGKFVERKHLGILDRPLESSGTLLFRAPGHLEKLTIVPKEESLILDQGNLTIENKARGQKRTLKLQEYPMLWAFVEGIRSTLAGDLATLSRYYEITLEGDKSKWRLQLLPAEARTREVVSEIIIAGHADRVTNIDTREPNGDHTEMTVSETPQ